MLKEFSITKGVFIVLFLFLPARSFAADEAVKENAVVITSQTLTADNKKNTAVFEGLVVARTDDIFIYSDKMEVVYDNSRGKIKKIRASGDVRVHKNDRAIFSEEAIYFGQEEKIVFNGEPKAVDGENVITGKQIIYFFRDDRTVVKGSRVVLKKKQE
jgi:lipopolysaccharide export system protein LptA